MEVRKKRKTKHLFLPCAHGVAGSWNRWKHGGAKCRLQWIITVLGAINSNHTFIRVLGFVGDISSSYDGICGCWLGKTRGRNERCYGDLRPLDDVLARAAGTAPRTKCISFRCSLGFFVLVPIGIIRPFYTTLYEYHTTWHRPVYLRLFFPYCFIVLYYCCFKIACDFFLQSQILVQCK